MNLSKEALQARSKGGSSKVRQLNSLNKSYLKAIDTLFENGLSPLFGRQDWKGCTDENSKARYYKVVCSKCRTVFESWFSGSKCSKCPNCNGGRQKAKKEESDFKLRIKEWLQQKTEVEDRGILYLSKFNVAFSLHTFDDSHSGPNGVDKRLSKNQTDEYLNNNIKLYHLWENIPEGLCRSIIASKLGITKRIKSSKVKCVEVSKDVAKEFLEYNHVDGFVKSSKYYALVLKNKEQSLKFQCEHGSVIAVMTLMNRMIQSRKEQYWEIGRFATQRGYTVEFGYSRLIKHAIDYLKSINIHYLVSYCNRDLSPDPNNTFYSKYGFKFLGDSGCIYHYFATTGIDLNGVHYPSGSIVGRQTLQKQKLIKHYKDNHLPLRDDDTEYSLAVGLGFVPFYNSGNFKYILEF